MKKLILVAAGVLLAAGIAWANFAWGEHEYHSYCYPCGSNIQEAPMGNPPIQVPVAWDKHLTYNGVPGSLPCPHLCDNPL